MSRYIDAEKINLNYLPLTALGGQMFAYEKDIDETPTEDVAPVKHGNWICDVECDAEYRERITTPTWNRWSCSECKTVAKRGWSTSEGGCKPSYKWCPECGAKMDEEAVHDPDVNKRFMREIKELCKRKDKRS